jgi:peptide/nickel transport system permease protein
MARFDPTAIGIAAGATAPDAVHWFGTDSFGRDVWSRFVHGARISLAIGAATAVLAVGIGTAVGAVAGFCGGAVDGVLMRAVDVALAFPRLFLVLLIVGWLHPSIALTILVLALTGWMHTARLVRAAVRSVRHSAYVRAAEILGLSWASVLWRHVLPNALAPVLISASAMVGQTILAESALSFLGLGVPLPAPSWGAMVEEGRRAFPDAWWVSAFPGIAITATVLGWNLLGDALHDALDPRLSTEVDA